MTSKRHFSNYLVAASATAITLYTVALLLLAVVNIIFSSNVWPPTELTGLWYSYWTAELVMLTTIKVTKVRNKYESGDDPEN